MPTAHEQFSEQFRKWELRGRGWQVFDGPVQPEPPFVPFDFHRLQEPPAIDNGLRPTFLSSLYRKLTALPPEPPPVIPEPEEEPEPHPLVREKIVEFQASLPDKLDISKEAFEQFLLNLSLCREPIAFELLGVHKRVTAHFAAASEDAPLLRRQLQAYFPEAVFQMQENILKQIWNTCSGKDEWVIEFGLAHEFMLPLANGKLDPFIGIVGALAELQQNELGLFQVLFQPADEPWPESIMRSVTHADGKPFFVNSPELAGAAEHKISKPLYAAVVRIVVKTGTKTRTLQIARDLAGSLRVFAHPNGNELIPLHNEEYPFVEHVEDVMQRQSRRSGMVLNSDELIGFVHLPSSAVRSPVFQRQTTKSKAAPTIARHGNALLGNNDYAGQTVEVRLSPEQRTRHCHIIGASGTGKSTLLFNLIRQDIENGEGVAVLDPHGDLIDRILGIIPESRINDVVLVDPSDEQFSVGFNILSAHSDLEKNLLASDLVSVFQRLSTSWGDQMNSVLKNAILAFLESDRRGTLADLQQFLIETPFRNEFLKSVRDTYVVNYWQKSFPLLSGTKSIGSILTRLDTFLAQKPIRYMVSQRENRLDFAHIMDTGKIFLAKLPEGLLGRENSHLLGTLLVSKFQQTAMSRQAQQITERRDFWLYIDEFANFITPSMAEILSGARKYRIGLTLAHHELHQLQRNPEVASAVMSHPYTRIVFRVGDDDAKKLGEGFAFFEANDLRNLETGQAVARVERSDYDFNLSVPLPAEPDKSAAARRHEVITASRKEYGTSRADVEAILAKSREAAVPLPTIKIEPSVRPVAEPPKIAEIPKAAVQESEEEEGQHNALKERIRVQAETLEYSVTFEESVAGSQGRADVVLRRGTHSIACEITVATPVEYEVANLTKCLKADYWHVAAISRNRKKLERIQELLSQTAAPEQIARVGFYIPEEFISKLYDWAMDDPGGAAVERNKPNKRKIAFDTVQMTDGERREREAEMLKSLAEVMKRK
jgi:type IV secretion system coupling TraD/TrwB family protein